MLAVAPGVADASAVPFLRGGVSARVYGKRHGDADRDALDAVAAAPPPWEAPPPKRKKGSGGRRAQKRRRKEAARAAEASSDDDDEEPDVDLAAAPWALLRDAVLTRAQLAANDYPLPREAAPRHVALEAEDDGEDLGVVDGAEAYRLPSRPRAAAILERCGAETVRRSGAPPGERRRVFGLDCEMVQTTAGARVARCTLVDGAGAVVFDELAKPAEKVVDYCTQWSGLDEAALRGVATSVDQVRAALLETVDADDVLVGHSLDCDLRALGLAHHACADTALLYGHPRGAPYKKKLKQLAKEFLDREIQDGPTTRPSTRARRSTSSRCGSRAGRRSRAAPRTPSRGSRATAAASASWATPPRSSDARRAPCPPSARRAPASPRPRPRSTLKVGTSSWRGSRRAATSTARAAC